MQKMLYLLLFGSGILAGFTGWSGHTDDDGRFSLYLAAMVVASLSIAGLLRQGRRRVQEEQRAEDAVRDLRQLSLVRREVKSKIPKNSPRRESETARNGMIHLSATRAMAELVRKPRLREDMLWICDFAELVLETIRHMPEDTPAASAFIENHLARLREAVERYFEITRTRDYVKIASLDMEIDILGDFITTFCKQQDDILFEGLGGEKRNNSLLA